MQPQQPYLPIDPNVAQPGPPYGPTPGQPGPQQASGQPALQGNLVALIS